MRDAMKVALASMIGFMKLVLRRSLHLRYNRLGKPYALQQHGTYVIFRETECLEEYSLKPVTLVVGFRLKFIGANPILHWAFQRVCVLTTPFWSGLEGFRARLWLVDPETKNYLGIYEWSGRRNAKYYAAILERVLRPLSVPGSVWHHIHRQGLETYLHKHEAELFSTKKVVLHA